MSKTKVVCDLCSMPQDECICDLGDFAPEWDDDFEQYDEDIQAANISADKLHDEEND